MKTDDTTTTPAVTGDIVPAGEPLGATLETHAKLYLDARRRFGQSTLDAARAVAEARAEARHGQWDAWLQRVGLSASGAKRLIDIHEAAQSDPRFGDAVRTGFLSATVAGELAQGDAALLDRFLTREQPPTRAEVQQAKRASNPPPVADLPPPPAPSVLPDLRSALIRLDAHTAQPLLYGIPPGALRNEWRNDVELVREIGDCVHRLDRDGAHRVAQRIADRELRETMLRAYPAPAAPAPEADVVPPPAPDPYAPIRSAVLAGPHRWPAARKLIADLEQPARTSWGNDLLAVQAIDQDLRKGQIGRLDNLLSSIVDPALAEAQRALTEGACRELGLVWPAPAPAAAPADAAAVLAALERRAHAVGAKLLIYGEDVQLTEPSGATTRFPDGEEAALEARIAALEAASPAARGIAPHCPPEKIPADWDHWRDYARAAGGDLALSQFGIVTWVHGGRVAGHAYPHKPDEWPALCERIADALPEPVEPPEPTPAPPLDGIVSDWAIVEDEAGEVVMVNALGLDPVAGEAIAAAAAALRLLALGQAHAVDTPQLDHLMGEVQTAAAISPAAAGTLISVLELIAQDADRAAEQQARAA